MYLTLFNLTPHIYFSYKKYTFPSLSQSRPSLSQSRLLEQRTVETVAAGYSTAPAGLLTPPIYCSRSARNIGPRPLGEPADASAATSTCVLLLRLVEHRQRVTGDERAGLDGRRVLGGATREEDHGVRAEQQQVAVELARGEVVVIVGVRGRRRVQPTAHALQVHVAPDRALVRGGLLQLDRIDQDINKKSQ